MPIEFIVFFVVIVFLIAAAGFAYQVGYKDGRQAGRAGESSMGHDHPHLALIHWLEANGVAFLGRNDDAGRPEVWITNSDKAITFYFDQAGSLQAYGLVDLARQA